MPDTDSALLARLNALRKSPISLTQNPTTLESPSTPQRSLDPDLTARFRNLTPNSGVSAPSRDFEETPCNEEDDQTVEELLRDLGPEEQWNVQRDEGARIRGLMEEARMALPKEEKEERKELVVEVGIQVGGDEKEEQRLEEEGEEQEKGSQDEADDYVQRVLAELEIERKYEGADEEEERNPETERDGGNEEDEDALALPSAPTELPSSPAPVNEADSNVDDMLSARFASLSLPAAPSFNPSKKPVTIQKSLRKSNLPKYTDEDIESWCCICNEDATVKCLGCDGDLYCSECWNQGHGTGPGQERGHRALAYSRDSS